MPGKRAASSQRSPASPRRRERWLLLSPNPAEVPLTHLGIAPQAEERLPGARCEGSPSPDRRGSPTSLKSHWVNPVSKPEGPVGNMAEAAWPWLLLQGLSPHLGDHEIPSGTGAAGAPRRRGGTRRGEARDARCSHPRWVGCPRCPGVCPSVRPPTAVLGAWPCRTPTGEPERCPSPAIQLRSRVETLTKAPQEPSKARTEALAK